MTKKLPLLAAIAAAAAAAFAGTALAQGGAPQPGIGQPWIGGNHQVGQLLAANAGDWSSDPSVFYTYQWQRCGAGGVNCAAIAGATAQSYTLADSDSGSTIRVVVTGTNNAGSAAATSAATAPIDPAGGVLGAVFPAGAIEASHVALPNRLVIDQIKLTPGKVLSRLPIVALFHISDMNGSPVSGALVKVSGVPAAWIHTRIEATSTADGWARLRIFPTSSLPLGSSRVFAIVIRARVPGTSGSGTSTSRTISFAIR